MYILGIVMSLFGVLLTMYFKHLSFAIFQNPSAIVLFIITILATLTATQSFKVFWNGLKAVISANTFISEEDRGRAASLFRLLSKTTALASLILVLTGVIWAITNISDMEIFVELLVAALMGPVIGLFLILAVFEPAVIILKRRQGTEHKPKSQN